MNFKRYYRKLLQLCQIARISKKKVWVLITLVTGLSLLAALVDAAGIAILFPAIFQSGSSENLYAQIPFLTEIIDFSALSTTTVFFLIASFFGMKIALDLLVEAIKAFATSRFAHRLRSNFVTNILKRPILQIEQLRVGEMSNRIMLNTRDASNYVGLSLGFVNQLLQISGYLIALFIISTKIFFILIFAFGILYFFLKHLYDRISKMQIREIHHRDDTNRHFVERLSQIRLVKIIGTESEEIIELDKKFKNWSDVIFKHGILSSISQQFSTSIFLFGALGLGILSLLGTNIIAKLIVVMGSALLIIQRIIFKFNSLNAAIVKIRTREPGVDCILQDFDYVLHSKIEKRDKELDRIEVVTFKDVSFAYNGQNVIENINLTLAVGRSVLVRGASGSGKTSLANLLRSVTEPTSGEILLNGNNCRDIKSHCLSEQIGYASQEAFIFNGTIRENLLYGNPKDLSDKQIMDVLKFCHIDDFVKNLPNELDYMVTERGSVLSGGEKQRLNLARILLRDPSVIILDEITNNLDAESKKKIIETVSEILKTKICFIISHDPEFKFPGIRAIELKEKGLAAL